MSSSSPSSKSASSSDAGTRGAGSQFGPNEWLIEEMYERYLQDPSSVDSAWHEFFADYKADQAADQQTTGEQRAGGNGQVSSGRSAQQQSQPQAAQQPAQQQPAQQQPAQQQPAQQAQATQQSRQGEQAKPSPQQAAKAAPAKSGAAQSTGAQSAGAQEGSGEQSKTLRGPAAAIAKNMEQSLTVPTATSVRAVPAKLLFDNRIVINNHLKRNKGGKVSFTHLIGYALVRALRDFPNMNRHFGEDEKGKPAAITPEHITSASPSTCPARTAPATWWWPPSRAASR